MPKPALPSTSAEAHAFAARLIEFHRATFGDARMSADDAPAESAAADQATSESASAATDLGFPEATPVAEMEPAQQTAYWKHQARKHEGRANARSDYDSLKAENASLKAATQTDAEKAIEQARAEAATAAKAEVRGEFAEKLVGAKFESALATKKSPDEIATILAGLDLKKFLDGDGEVDADKVSSYAAGLVPAGTTWPDTGGGKRGDATRQTKREAGIAEAQKRFPTKSETA